MDGGGLGRFLGGITTIALVAIVVSNWKGVAGIMNGIGGLYSAAAGASRGVSSVGK